YIKQVYYVSYIQIFNGFVKKKTSTYPRHLRMQKTFHELLKDYDIPCISGVDTRSITRKIRNYGVLKAAFTDDKADIPQLIEELKVIELPRDEVKTVSTKTPYVSTGYDLSVVLVDFGKKQNI